MSNTTIQVIAGICAVAPVMATAYLKLTEVLKPLLSRRKLKLCIVCDTGSQGEVDAWLKKVRSDGYVLATATRSAQYCLGQDIAILWQPDANLAPALIAEILDASPSCIVWVFSYRHLSNVKLAHNIMAGQSLIRLRGDLQALAESL